MTPWNFPYCYNLFNKMCPNTNCLDLVRRRIGASIMSCASLKKISFTAVLSKIMWCKSNYELYKKRRVRFRMEVANRLLKYPVWTKKTQLMIRSRNYTIRKKIDQKQVICFQDERKSYYIWCNEGLTDKLDGCIYIGNEFWR